MEELDNEFAASVRAEFLEQSPLYPEAPRLPDEPPGDDAGIKSPFMHYVDEEERSECRRNKPLLPAVPPSRVYTRQRVRLKSGATDADGDWDTLVPRMLCWHPLWRMPVW